MSWEQAIEAFERHLRIERNLSPNTLRAYVGDLSAFAAFARDGGIQEPGGVSKAEVRRWLATLHRDRTAATIGRKLSAVRACVCQFPVCVSVPASVRPCVRASVRAYVRTPRTPLRLLRIFRIVIFLRSKERYFFASPEK